MPSLNVVQELNQRGTIGLVEPFASNNTRYVRLRPLELKKLSEKVFHEYGGNTEWVTVSVTPKHPVAVYPTEGNPADCEMGIALAPGLKKSEMEDL